MIPENVISYFSVRNVMPQSEAATVFADLERFLNASSLSRRVPSKLVDEAWHVFILHTQQYAEFCTKHFGRFIHHVPDAPDANIVNSDESRCSNCSSNCKSK